MRRPSRVVDGAEGFYAFGGESAKRVAVIEGVAERADGEVVHAVSEATVHASSASPKRGSGGVWRAPARYDDGARPGGGEADRRWTDPHG
ncbi:MAG: hypothetical protein AAGM22_08410 [Acidobacteriota bacterium]